MSRMDLLRVERLFLKIREGQGVIMAEIDNLKAAAAATKQEIANLSGKVSGLVNVAADIKAKLDALAGQTSISPADVQAVADDLNSQVQAIQQLETTVDTATAADSGTSTPPAGGVASGS